MRIAIVLGLSATLILAPSVALRAETYAYPGEGQSTKQQQRDKQACQEWATQQTGFDPSNTAGRKLGGAGGGAAMGAARGAAEGEAREGAARGALRGRLLSKIRQRREERSEDSATQGGEPRQGQREDYDRAYGACLAGRGYSVK
jgi:hypothetical protein